MSEENLKMESKYFKKYSENLKAAWNNIFSKNKTALKKTSDIQQTVQSAVSQSGGAPSSFSISSNPTDINEILKSKRLNQVRAMYPDTYEATVIAKDTEVNGSVTSRTSVTVNGTVKGNVISEANIKIMGSVEGDVIGKAVEISGGNIIGNIKSKTSVAISDKSTVQGDIKCDRLNLNGSIKGNVNAQSSVSLGGSAVINGNVSAQNLSIQEGAIVDGAIKVTREKVTPSESTYQLNQPAMV